MLAEQVRSGLAETYHEGAVAVVDADGDLVAWAGDIDRPFFLRSAAKPFQALVSQESGADLTPLELALACASHRGYPAHIAIVESMLAKAGLDESVLRCIPDWPLGERARERALASGAGERRRIWHNCSGKHSGFLRACVASGWPLESYLEMSHPLQARIGSVLSELGEHPVDPMGVDGCGAPVPRTTTRAMARLFMRLATDDRLVEVFTAMHRYPALIGANGEGDTEIAIATNSAAKGGAAGCVGVAVEGRFGVAVKSWDGLGIVANVAAVATLAQLGVTSRTADHLLEPVLRPPLLGGGSPVGSYESKVELNWV